MKRPVFKISFGLGLLLALPILVFCCLLPAVEFFEGGRSLFSRITMFSIFLLLGSPGFLLLFTLNELRKEVDRYTIKNFSSMFYGSLMLVLGFLFLPEAIRSLGVVNSSLSTFGALFVSIAGLLPVYIMHTRALMREAGIVSQPGELFGRPTLRLLAFLLMMCFFGVTELLDSIGLGSASDAHGGFPDTVFFLGTFLVPYLAYRLSVRWLLQCGEE